MVDLREHTTLRLRLEPLRSGHAEALFAALNDPAVSVFLDENPPESVDSLRRRLTRLETRSSPDGSEAWLNWAILVLDGPVIGYVQATIRGRTAEIAYVLQPARWGQGYAREATVALLQMLADDWNVERVTATVDQSNARSVSLLRRLGFAVVASDSEAGDACYELVLAS
ncbi:MAG TPA: GNAT family N-acetyltransferase [Acidimicrobiales bacterium]|jgi:ribosomal-protein-alanine N-acetyltransferase|nr:GNAT family N-acetyltransferase [Acidimicrobiales bacterium]